MLDQWQFSYTAIIGGIIFPVFYLIIHKFKQFVAWTNKEEGPKERVWVYIILWCIIGTFIGGMSQDSVDRGITCYKQNKKLIGCIIESYFKNEKQNTE